MKSTNPTNQVKPKLFIDVDNTITDSLKAFVDTYNMLYKFHPQFRKATYYSKQYNLKDQCPLVKNVDDIYSSKVFFNNLRFINPNTKDILYKLSKDFDIVICSLGTPKNIAIKSMWLSQKLPFIENYMLVTNNYPDRSCKLDKSLVNMNNSIFIDDMPQNLNSSNAKYKIRFGKEYAWNKDNNKDHIKCLDWNSVYNVCMKFKDKIKKTEIDKEKVNEMFNKQLKNKFSEVKEYGN